MRRSPPGIFLLPLPSPLCRALAAVIPFPLICISTSRLQSEVWAHEVQHSLTQNPFGVPALSVTAASRVKQTGFSALAPSQLCVIYEKGLEAVTSCKSTSFGSWWVWAKQKESQQLFCFKVMQQRVQQQVNQTAKGALLTLTFIYGLRVGLSNKGRGDKDLTTPIESCTSSAGTQLPVESNLASRFKDATIANSRNKTAILWFSDERSDSTSWWKRCMRVIFKL